MNWDTLLRIFLTVILSIFRDSGGSPDAVSTGSNEAPWMWMSTSDDLTENNSGTEVLEVVEVLDEPHVVATPIDLNTEPRFVGHLRRKLCKVGLGIGKAESNYDCGNTTSTLGRSKRSPQFLRVNEHEDSLGDDRIGDQDNDRDPKGGRSVEGTPSGKTKTDGDKNLHEEPQPRILKTIGNMISKLPLHYANLGALKTASPEPPNFLGAHVPHPAQGFQHSLGSPSLYPMEMPLHPLSTPSHSPFSHPLYSDLYPSMQQPVVPHPLRKIKSSSGGFFFPESSVEWEEESLIHSPLEVSPDIPFPLSLSPRPGLPVSHPISSILDNDPTRRKGYPIMTDLHDQPIYYKTYSKYPIKYPTKDASYTNNACSFVNCKELSYFCPSSALKRRHSRQLQTTHVTGNDLPFSCGLHEVCCNLDSLESSLNRIDVSVPSRTTSETRSCGKSSVDSIKGRITGGLPTRGETKFGEFPWQSAILKKEGNDNVYVCAGSLIDKSHVLTAAHCVEGYAAGQLRVRLGEWDVNRDTEFYPHVEYDVVGLAIHPEFYSGNLINDISIVRMLYPIDLNKMPHISPVCLPTPGLSFAGSRCWVSGWGKSAFGKSGKYQNLLKKVDLPVIPRQTCNAILRETRLGPGYSLHPGMMCAGGEPKRDACKGDGGGPLSCRDIDGNFVLTGIVSWGIGCGQPGVPGIYINVEYYVGWIRQMIES